MCALDKNFSKLYEYWSKALQAVYLVTLAKYMWHYDTVKYQGISLYLRYYHIKEHHCWAPLWVLLKQFVIILKLLHMFPYICIAQSYLSGCDTFSFNPCILVYLKYLVPWLLLQSLIMSAHYCMCLAKILSPWECNTLLYWNYMYVSSSTGPLLPQDLCWVPFWSWLRTC